MAFTMNIDMINEWRAEQRFVFDSDPLPTMPDVKPGPSLGVRIIYILGAIMFFTCPVGFLFFWLAPIFSKIGSGTPKIFAYLIYIGITGAFWKVALSFFIQGVGRPPKEDSVWEAADYFDKKRNAQSAARYYLEALTAPWEIRLSPKGYSAYQFWRQEKNKKNVRNDYLDLLADLLFVELWLEVVLNSGSYYRGAGDAYRHALPEVVTDSERLVGFASIMHDMSENQHNEDGKPYQLIVKLKELFKAKAPRAWATLKGLEGFGVEDNPNWPDKTDWKDKMAQAIEVQKQEKMLPKKFLCPSCGKTIRLSEKERQNCQFDCPKCGDSFEIED